MLVLNQRWISLILLGFFHSLLRAQIDVDHFYPNFDENLGTRNFPN